MGILYNYKWTLDFLVILYWEPEVRFAIKMWGPPREKGIPECSCFEPKLGKMQVNYYIALFYDDRSFWKLLVKMGIPYNYKWTLDFLVILYWDLGGTFC